MSYISETLIIQDLELCLENSNYKLMYLHCFYNLAIEIIVFLKFKLRLLRVKVLIDIKIRLFILLLGALIVLIMLLTWKIYSWLIMCLILSKIYLEICSKCQHLENGLIAMNSKVATYHKSCRTILQNLYKSVTSIVQLIMHFT